MMLERKIPPPLVMLICAVISYATSKFGPNMSLSPSMHMATIAIAILLALVCLFPAVAQFKRENTTVNPLPSGKARHLVVSGVFNLSRNPMYLGMALLLFAFSFYLQSLFSFSGLLVFMVYITRFQIIPEERHLNELFGDEFKHYKQRVRRWF